MTICYFPEEEIQEIYIKYKEGLSLNKCAKLLGLKDYRAVKTQFKKFGFPEIPGHPSNRLKNTNPNFFKKIDKEIKAYALGFIYADGCVSGALKIKVNRKDRYVVEEISKAIHGGAIYLYEYEKEKNCSTYKCANVQIINDLKEIGVVPNKTYVGLSWPLHLPENMTRHFIRGFLDGDGSCGIYFYDKKILRNVQFTCADLKFLEKLESVIKKNCGANSTYLVEKPRNNNSNFKCTIPCYDLVFRSRTEIKKIFSYLYDNHEFSLLRKYNKMYLCTLTPREQKELKSLLPCRD